MGNFTNTALDFRHVSVFDPRASQVPGFARDHYPDRKDTGGSTVATHYEPRGTTSIIPGQGA